MTHRFAFAVIVVLQLATIAAQPASPVATAAEAVDEYVTAEMARRHIPGVALAVVRGGKVIKAQGYGRADLEHEIPVTPETVFKIGSVSKQFLATASWCWPRMAASRSTTPSASTSTASPSRGRPSPCGTS
jgi:CubicO group peptidase (beta-lactamase class C family)